MAQQWQIRRGTNSENNNFTGAIGEVTMDTDRKELRLHDGSTQGGTIIGRNYKSNCITEISQDIKLELNDGTLTLKIGSKVYAPNGASVFDIRDITADQTYTQATNGQYLLFARQDMSIWGDLTSNVTSGITPPAGTGTFYNTTTNSIDWYNGGTYNERHYSFPFALITVSNGRISKIDQVFNGFGYIGKCTFVLPGVRFLSPNGRNLDGSLVNIEKTISNVTIYNLDTESSVLCFLGSDGLFGYGVNNYFEQDNKPSGFGQYGIWYDTVNNYIYTTGDSGATWNKLDRIYLGRMIKASSGNISSLETKQTFQAVDASGTDYVIAYQKPTAANSYTWYRKYKSGWIEQGGKFVVNSASVSADTYSTANLTFPVPFSALINWNVQAKHDRFNAGFVFDSFGAASTVSVYQVNDSGTSFVNPFVVWTACGFC